MGVMSFFGFFFGGSGANRDREKNNKRRLTVKNLNIDCGLWDIKNFKQGRTPNNGGYPYTVALYLDGKKVADCQDRGDDRGVHYSFKSREIEREFQAFVKALPVVDCNLDGYSFSCQPSEDMFLEELIARKY